MISYAFFTDIHGNFNALEAVLNDIREFGKRYAGSELKLVCLGDSFDGGPDPVAVFEALEELECPQLRGNHEDYLFECRRNPAAERFLRPLWKFVPWTVSKLGSRLERIENDALERWNAQDVPLSAVHAAVGNNRRVPDFFVQQSQLSQSFRETYEEDTTGGSRILFNGHSHYLGRHCEPSGKSIWFNCGSVGYPFVEKLPEAPDAPLATWVLAESPDGSRFRITNRRIPYSSDGLLRRYAESGALEECAPFSYAIAAQSLFNQDVVYPFFQSVKNRNLSPQEMSICLMAELRRQDVFGRINRLLRRAGLKEVQKE